MTAFTLGDTCYLIDGAVVEYLGAISTGHLVRRVYEVEEDDSEPMGPTYGRAFDVAEVYAEPPLAKYDQQTQEARESLADLRRQINAAALELREAKSGREEALKAIGAHPDLVPLGEWLRGEITHIVKLPIYGGTISILPFEEAIQPTDRDDVRDGKVRLLSLVGGRTKGWDKSTTWQLSAYSDGSGSSFQHCLLATSRENALERLQVWVDKELSRSGANDHSKLAIAISAVELGLIVSPAWATRVADAAAERKAKELESARKQLESYRNQLSMQEARVAVLEGAQL